jgi:hypothetical protein
MNQAETEETKYPGVDLAYPLAVQSYDLAWKRFDAWDGRLQTLLSMYVTVTLAVPLAAHALNLKFTSLWFWLAAFAFLGTFVFGICGRLFGKIIDTDPSSLYKGFLHYSEWEFKKEFLCWAAENHPKNKKTIARKHHIAVIMTACFILEIFFVAFWAFLP